MKYSPDTKHDKSIDLIENLLNKKELPRSMKEISDEEYDNENLLYLIDYLNNKNKFKNYLSKDLTKQVYDNGNRVIYKCMIKHIIEALNDNEIVFSENNSK